MINSLKYTTRCDLVHYNIYQKFDLAHIVIYFLLQYSKTRL